MKKNVDDLLRSAGLQVSKTSDETMLDQLGASVGTNSCSVVIHVGKGD